MASPSAQSTSSSLPPESHSSSHSVTLSNSTNLQAVVGLSVVYCLMFASCGYWLWRFRQQRKQFGFGGRKKHLTATVVFFAMLWILARCSLLWLEVFKLTRGKSSLATVAMVIHSTVTTVSFVTCSGLLSLRIWLIFFHVQLAVANSDNAWMALITQPLSFTPKVVAILPLVVMDADLDAIVEEMSRKPGDTLSSFRTLSDGSSARTRLSTLRRSVGYLSPTHRCSVHRHTYNSNSLSASLQSADSGLSNDSEKGKTATNWFFANTHTYGNTRWLASRLWFVAVPFYGALLATGCYKPLRTVHSALFTLWGVGVVAFLFAVALHYPKYQDSLRIGKEIALIGRIAIVSAVAYFVSFLFELLKSTTFAVTATVSTLLIFTTYLMILTQTKWVLKNFPNGFKDPPKVSCFEALFAVECGGGNTGIGHITNKVTTLLKVTSNSEHIEVQLTAENQMVDLKLREVLADANGFRLFMAHLFSEFSEENLLCLIELTQFSESIIAEMDAMELVNEVKVEEKQTEEERESGTALRLMKSVSSSFRMQLSRTSSKLPVDDISVVGLLFPESVTAVKSSISWNRKLSKEQKFVVLVAKYIAFDAEMEVNIPYGMRRNLLRLSRFLTEGEKPEAVSIEQLTVGPKVFHKVAVELMSVMTDSLMRFRHQKEYLTLRQEWNLRRAPKSKMLQRPSARGIIAKLSPMMTPPLGPVSFPTADV